MSQLSLRSIGLCVCMIGISWAWALAAQPATSPSDDWGVPLRASRKKNPIPPDPGSLLTGKEVFASNCAMCHGQTGKGDGPSAQMLNPAPSDLTKERVGFQTDGCLFWKISQGHRPMPTFENVLPEEARWNVVNYQRVLAPASRPATQPATMP